MTRNHWLAVGAILLVAAGLRLWDLDLRPPHHDEGVNGMFADQVLRDGAYTYDPANYHGPSYFYLLAGSRKVFGFGLWQLRVPGAVLGIAMCLTPLLARRRLGATTAVAACAVLAVSPTLVYYARYAIHETLLAALGLVVAACVLRWAEHGRGAWMVAAAAALAGMIATKETTIIFVGVSGLWLLAEVAVESVRGRRLTVLGRTASWSWRATVVTFLALAVMATIHVLLFTGFFRAPRSLGEQLHRSVRAYVVWSETGTGHTGHAKDACYYLHLGVRYELVLYAVAVVGLIAGFRERWIRAPALVGFGMLAVYSAVSYKMPWLPMSWLALLALPAAHGLTVLARLVADEVSTRIGRATTTIVALVPALVITARSSFVRPADKVEQLAYVHTDADYNVWFPLIEAGGRRIGPANLIVAVDHDAQWPLAWSLTPYKRTRWRARGDEDVIIAAVSRAPAVEARFTRVYLRRQFQIRDSAEPGYLYLRRSLYARILDTRRLSASFVIVGSRVASDGFAVATR